MADSILKRIRDSVVAEFANIPDVGGATSCVPWKLLKTVPGKETGTVEIKPLTFPPNGYPGTVVAVDDSAITVISTNQKLNESSTVYEVPLTFAHYATSDGSTESAAQEKAWKDAEAIHRHMVLFTPDGGRGPLRPGDQEAIGVDATTHGVLMEFFARYEIQVRLQ